MSAFIDFAKINAGDNVLAIADYYGLPVAGDGGYICPACGNGSGKDSTGLSAYPNDKHGGNIELRCFKCGENFTAMKLVALKEFGETYTEGKKSVEVAAKAMQILNGRARDQPPPVFAKKNAKPAAKAIDAESDLELKAMIRADIAKAQSNLRGFVESEGKKFRGLTYGTLKRFGCGYLEKWNHPNHRLALQRKQQDYLPRPSDRFIIPAGDHYNAVLKQQDRNAANYKFWKMHAGQKKCFGLDLVPTETDLLLLCEGEIDAMSICQATGGKYEVVATGGASENNFIADLQKKFPAKKPVIVILFDTDDTGRQQAEVQFEKLFRAGFTAQIKFVSAEVTKFDFNDVLIQQGDTILAEKINAVLAESERGIY